MKLLNMLVVVLSIVIMNYNVFAYDTKYTHPQLTTAAIGISNLDKYLTNYLGLPDGIKTNYNRISIIDLMKTGSIHEDGYLLPPRADNHFWDPIWNNYFNPSRPNNGGLVDWFSGNSNKEWALRNFDCTGPLVSGNDSISSSCNDYSWNKARNEFYQAVTGTDQASRDLHFQNMYECLGRVIHLIEDMGVPAHTRNDFNGHMSFTPGSWPFAGNLYEYHVETKADPHNKKSLNYLSNLASSVTSSMIPAFDTPEKYWGDGLYNGTNPAVTITNDAGLAEYSNANFLSLSAMFPESLSPRDKHYFPYPRTSSLDKPLPQVITAEDGKQDTVEYFNKIHDGETVYPLACANYFYHYAVSGNGSDISTYGYVLTLDDTVHEAYAQKLVPKTIAYATGLINYFFRGTMSIQNNTIQAFDDMYQIKLVVANTTSTNEVMDKGNICLVIHCQNGNKYIKVSEASNPAVTSIPAGGRNLIFNIPKTLVPIGLNGLLDLYVIYQGNLSRGTPDETNAVCVGYQQIEYFSDSEAFIFSDFCETNCPERCYIPDMPFSNSGPETQESLGCVGHFLLGCKYKFSIENVSGPIDGVSFLKIGINQGNLGLMAYLDASQANGSFEVKGTCGDSQEISYYIKFYIIGPGSAQFDLVLTNLTTGGEVDRRLYRFNFVTPIWNNGEYINCTY
jgi:hypothetical protein